MAAALEHLSGLIMKTKRSRRCAGFALFPACSINRRRLRGGVGAGAHRVLPVSGLRAWRCPAGVCPAPRSGPALAPGTTPDLGSGDLRGDGGLADAPMDHELGKGAVWLHSLCSMALKIWYSSTRLSSSSTDVVKPSSAVSSASSSSQSSSSPSSPAFLASISRYSWPSSSRSSSSLPSSATVAEDKEKRFEIGLAT